MRFCIVTLGCKVNQYESQAMSAILLSRGHTQVQHGESCDVCIVNTCAVTAESARKSRQAVRSVIRVEKSSNTKPLIAVCGCFSELEPVSAAMLGADIVSGSGNRREFALKVERLFAERNAAAATTTAIATTKPAELTTTNDIAVVRAFEELAPGSSADRTRAYLKIQDGCDNYCAYCVIPYARGRARSLPLARCAEYARRLDEQGFREIVVTGIEISSYGKDFSDGTSACSNYSNRKTLADAVEAISESAANTRVRLGSLDPGSVTEVFIERISALSGLCGHFHLSLQSGCNDTLRRMGRKYGTEVVERAIASLRRRFPDCGITADLITGFPGETDAEFSQTMDFIKSCGFSSMHIFPFSPRRGTRADAMPDQVEKQVRHERARIASALAKEMAEAFRHSQIGKVLSVLFEREQDGVCIGRSDNYLKTAVKEGGDRNSIRPVLISACDNGILRGEII